MGALSKISKAGDGMVYLIDICQGTGVSADMNYYFNRARNTNDNHGLGSFLIMNEYVAYNNLAWYETTSIPNPKGITNEVEVKIHPNPCQHYIELSIENTLGNISIELFTIPGQKVKHVDRKQYTSNNKIRIGTDDLQNGVYICKVNTVNGTRAMKILVSK